MGLDLAKSEQYSQARGWQGPELEPEGCERKVGGLEDPQFSGFVL